MISDEVLVKLKEFGIACEVCHHAPARTMEDLVEVDRKMNCVAPKNLFLTPRNHSAYYLCLAHPDSPAFRTAEVSKQIGSSRLSFGSEEDLYALLRTTPGAVTPLGLLFDGEKKVSLLIDERLRDVKRLGFHPCDNAMTVVLSGDDFFRVFLPRVGYAPRFVTLGGAE